VRVCSHVKLLILGLKQTRSMQATSSLFHSISPPTPSPREFGASLIRKMRCSGRIHGERGVFFQKQIRYGVAQRADSPQGESEF
jgi:hypothetical protein